jgi:hypothetical protein
LSRADAWPDLTYADWKDTRATLHLWTQVLGKVRLKKATPVNHWWHTPLYVSARGLTTSAIPDGARAFELLLDFIDHRLVVSCSDGPEAGFALEPMSVAAFYARTMETLRSVGIEVRIYTTPSEIPGALPFEQDHVHAAYDPAAANRFWRALVQTQAVFERFRGRWLGKCSPVHFFWGSFDLALTRFSGRPAPEHPGVAIMPDFITREAYSHEVSSAGFWPGGEGAEQAVFYAYAYPVPPGFAEAPVRPTVAHFSEALGEFVLPYEAVRRAASPEDALLDFLQSTYEAAADLGGWDRVALERPAA